MTDPPLLKAQALGQKLGGRWVFRQTDLCVGAGQAVLLTGPNGCGKTTLLRQLAALCPPTQGQVFILGMDTVKDRLATRRHTAYLGAWPALYEDLSVIENLTLFTRARRGGVALAEVQQAAAQLGLGDRLHQRVRTLSSGLKKRTGLCLMHLSRTSLWLLDEPETTLDAQGAAWLLDTLTAHLSGGGAAVVATHAPGVFAGLAPQEYTLTPRGLVPVEVVCA